LAYRVITVLNKEQFEKLQKICDRKQKSAYAIAKKLLLELIEKEAKDVESAGEQREERHHIGKDRRIDELDL